VHWSLARQLLAVQVLLLTAVVMVAGLATIIETRRHTQNEARHQVLQLAQSVADNPLVAQQARSTNPAAVLQPYAERVRVDTGVDFVVIMAPDRTRWSHPDPAQLGKSFIGTIQPALEGRAFTETFAGTLGPSVRAVAPVRGDSGTVVALVAVGITTEAIHAQVLRQLPVLTAGLLILLAVALAGAWLVGRRLRRQTHGLGPAEITRMYEYHDAVLHSVREGLIVIDRQHRIGVVNDEARRLLGIEGDVVGANIAELELPGSLSDVLASGREVADELHLTGERLLVVNQSEARWEGRSLGTVATLRDRTELEALTGELDTTRAFAESLRSQAHESANRLHTVVVLVETGRYEQAVEFATAELELSQRLTDRVVAAVDEPVLAALLLGKVAQASERGVELEVTAASSVPPTALPARDLVTVIGNLIDNAIDAAVDGQPPRRVTLTLKPDDGCLLIRVADTGPGLDPDQVADAFTRGWSTKQAGRGLGLALVGHVVRRHDGSVEVERDGGAVFVVRLPLTELARP
jgi:sensor histidine kinase regulating citrate/malate metabolism